MKEVFQLTEKFSSVIDDPRVVSIIKECGGKMYMSEKKWESALNQFKQSFESMVDSGHPRAQTMLKYVILTQLLSKSETDYLTQREAKVFVNDPEIIAMTDLKRGFETNDIKMILNIVGNKKINLLSDPLIALYLDVLLRSVRLKALVAICKPYKAVKLEFLCQRINVDLQEIRSLLAELILEETIKGQIDQVAGVLELKSNELQMTHKHTAIRAWADTLTDLNGRLTAKLNYDQSLRSQN